MGRIFVLRNLVNLHTALLDVPDIFWDYSELEKFYKIAKTYLDTDQRIEVLNKKCTVISEMLEMLLNELHSRSAHKLEWFIIVLILLEFLVEIVDVVFFKAGVF